MAPAFVDYLLANALSGGTRTLHTPGMLFANRCTWAHAAAACADLLDVDPAGVLTAAEMAAVRGEAHPRALQVFSPEGSPS